MENRKKEKKQEFLVIQFSFCFLIIHLNVDDKTGKYQSMYIFPMDFAGIPAKRM